MIAAIFVVQIFFEAIARAGGDAEPFLVKRLVVHGDEYTLVLVPKKIGKAVEESEGALLTCPVLTVIGKFDDSTWRKGHVDHIFEKGAMTGPSIKSHRESLKVLADALKNRSVINFGYMGSGFNVIDTRNRCLVESNGLLLQNVKMVLSFWNGV